MSNLYERVEEAIECYGDQAYHVTVKMATIASAMGDDHGALGLSGVAWELMKMGYHWKPYKVRVIEPSKVGAGRHLQTRVCVSRGVTRIQEEDDCA